MVGMEKVAGCQVFDFPDQQLATTVPMLPMLYQVFRMNVLCRYVPRWV